MDIPEIRYARSGEVHIAYQVVGDGPVDMVRIHDWLSNLELQWELPAVERFLRRLASFSRLILFDKRGSGLSDRTVDLDLFTLEVRLDDIRAVMDAIGTREAVILGDGDDGAALATTFAATYPERTRGLILVESRARGVTSEDYAYGYTPEEFIAFHQESENFWGTEAYARRWLSALAPSAAHDPDVIRWFSRLLRQSASPGTARAFEDVVKEMDLRGILPAVHAPTLVLHRADDADIPVEAGKDLAARIPGARFVQLPGADGFPWAGDQDPLIDEIQAFVTGSRAAFSQARKLTTILFTDIVDSTVRAADLGDLRWTALLGEHDELARAAISKHRGTYVNSTGDGLVATFDGPARAVQCALEFMGSVRRLGLELRAGCHTGEIELTDGDIRGIAVHIASRVASSADPSEVLVSQTVKDLTAGSSLVFEDAGDHELKGVPDRWRLYRVVN